ncbi:MAG TPA: prephenate dehydrogenase/arogenate dehydrogenase family protein, partial [Vicinamibacterales bacterium]|nr:prephenate dehydrogenase/arogenate dehydrogenase family protein [Vicinamibacterales bacterium]
MIQRLAIVGVGLLGGSIALAARAHGLAREIVGIGRDRTRLEAPLRAGAVDRVTTDLTAGVRDADVLVLAANVLANERLLADAWPAVAPSAVVTDVGSTKRGIVAVAERLPGAHRFVGSHPMAGSEKSGYAVARPDLFRGAIVIVTPGDASEPGAVKTVTSFWEALGARVSALEPDTHDRVVAAISHLPHVVAWA